MTNRVLLGNLGGTTRLRVSRPGFDVTDLSLGPEKIAFDSAWPEILTVYKACWGDASTRALPVKDRTVAFAGYFWGFKYITVPFGETLPVRPMAMAWVGSGPTSAGGDAYLGEYYGPGDYPVPYRGSAKGYYPRPVITYSDRIDVSLLGYANALPSNGSLDYLIFHNRVDAYDTRESEGGTNRLLVGNHPTRGAGFYVSRRGADVLTCGDPDICLSSTRVPFQIAEAGSYRPTPRKTFLGNSTQPPTYSWIDYIDLAGSYPDYPPVIFSTDRIGTRALRYSLAPVEIQWVNARQIKIRVNGKWTPTELATLSGTIQWAIPVLDRSGTSAASPTNRVLMDASGLRISMPGVDVVTAPRSGLLFDSTRSMLHIARRGEIVSTGIASGTRGIVSGASNIPLTMFSAYAFGDWWCAPNFLSIEGRRTEGSLGYTGAKILATMADKANITYSFLEADPQQKIVYSIIDFSYYA